MCGIVITQDSWSFLLLRPGVSQYLCVCVKYMFVNVHLFGLSSPGAFWTICSSTYSEKSLELTTKCDIVCCMYDQGVMPSKLLQQGGHVCVCVGVGEGDGPYKATDRYQPLVPRVEIMQMRS